MSGYHSFNMTGGAVVSNWQPPLILRYRHQGSHRRLVNPSFLWLLFFASIPTLGFKIKYRILFWISILIAIIATLALERTWAPIIVRWLMEF